MRALVTGGDGFLGANLCKELIARGHEVVTTSLHRKNDTSLDALGVSCRTEYGDVTDKSFIDRVVSSSEADWIFHLAAVSIVRIADNNPGLALRTNILGTLNVLEAAGTGRKVLIASSDKAYGDHQGLPYTETMSLRPTGAYEVSKTCADHIANLYRAIVVRCANLYGPGDLNWSRLIPNSCKRALKGEAPQVYGDAVNDKREWLYVKDAVNAYITLAEHRSTGAFNVGSGESASPLEVAFEISEFAGSPHPETVDKGKGFYEIPCQSLNCAKIAPIWKAEHSLEDGLQETVDWYRGYLCG